MTDGPVELFVSVIAPLRNDADILAPFVDDVVTVLRANYTRWELILVDDASSDETPALLNRLLTQVESLRAIRLSKSFGTEIAISAGLESAIGDFVVVMQPDSDPPNRITEMIERSREGAAIVFGVQRRRPSEPWFIRVGAPMFFWLCNHVLGLDLPKNSTHFRVLSRQAVNAALQIRDRNRYLRTLGAFVGYRNQSVEYDPIYRRPKRRSKSLVEAALVAFNIIVSNSLHPLRLAVGFGLLVVAVNMVYLLYVALVYLFKPDVAEGWTTESTLMAVMFGSLSLMLTVLGAYLARLLEERGDHPVYFVQDERASSVRPLESLNVVSETIEALRERG
jgi:glycosyltransferase involved in cell wall biosynthesis